MLDCTFFTLPHMRKNKWMKQQAYGSLLLYAATGGLFDAIEHLIYLGYQLIQEIIQEIKTVQRLCITRQKTAIIIFANYFFRIQLILTQEADTLVALSKRHQLVATRI